MKLIHICLFLKNEKKKKKIISKFLMLFVNFEKIEKFKIVWKLKLQKIY